jgi:hypothetical protein
MLQRRTLLLTSMASLIPTFGIAQPEPPIFMHETLRRVHLLNGRTIADVLRDEFQRQVAYVPAHRTIATQHQTLHAQYDFELAYDGVPPGWTADSLAEEVVRIIVMEFAHELAVYKPLNLVAFDTHGIRIDPATFTPLMQFYVERNI